MKKFYFLLFLLSICRYSFAALIKKKPSHFEIIPTELHLEILRKFPINVRIQVISRLSKLNKRIHGLYTKDKDLQKLKADSFNCMNSEPLIEACRLGLFEIAKYLLEQKKIKIDDSDIHGNTPLHVAAREGHTKIVQMLLKKGADVNKEHSPLTVEHINPFASVDYNDYRESHGNTPLFFAVRNKKVETIKSLLAGGAQINAKNVDDNTALHEAARIEDKELVELLLKNGANKEAKNKLKKTPYQIAYNRGNIELGRFIMNYSKCVIL